MSDYAIDCKCKSRECHFESMQHCAQEQWAGRNRVDELERELAAKDRELAEVREFAAEALHVLNMSRATAMQKESDVSMAKTWLKRITAKEAGEVGHE